MDVTSLASTVSGAVISYSPSKGSTKGRTGGTLFGTTGRSTKAGQEDSGTPDQDMLWGAAIRAALKCAAASTDIRPFLTKGRFWRVKPGTPDSHVVTLLVPHDLTWELEGPMGDLSLRASQLNLWGQSHRPHTRRLEARSAVGKVFRVEGQVERVLPHHMHIRGLR
jgi:hypothetical protein